MFSMSASGTWHQSLFASIHFSALAPLPTSVVNELQATRGSTFLPFPPIAAMRWIRVWRSFMTLRMSWQEALWAGAEALRPERKRNHGDLPSAAILHAHHPGGPVEVRRERVHDALRRGAGLLEEVVRRFDPPTGPVEHEIDAVRAVEVVNRHRRLR